MSPNCNMLLNMLNDLAEAMKALDGKNWEDFLDRLERCFNVWDMCSRGQSDCSPGIFVSKVESAQFGNPLARFLHIDRDLSQGPWVG